jgi:O-antigen ligase
MHISGERTYEGPAMVPFWTTLITIPVREVLLYVFAIVAPFFMFSILFGRDTPGMWVVIVMGVLVLIESIQDGGRIWVDRCFRWLLLFAAVYFLVTFAMILQEPVGTVLRRTRVDRAITTDLRLIGVVASFLIFASILADAPERVLKQVLHVQMYTGAVIAGFGIMQYLVFQLAGSTALAGIEPTNEAFAAKSFVLRISGQRFFRSTGVFNEPSFFGFYLIPLIVKSFTAWYSGLTIGSKKVHIGLMVIFGAALLTNFSFTALMGVFAIAIVVVVVGLLRSPRVALSLAAIAIAFFGILVVSPIGSAMLERFGAVFALRDLSTLDRLLRVYTSTLVFLDNPVFGVGPGGYAFWYTKLGGLDYTIMASPLNIWLSILTDVGIVGFVFFILFLVSIMKRAFRYLDRHPLVGIYLWSTLAHLVLLSTVDIWFVEMIWFELAMLLAVVAGEGLRSARAPAGGAHA